jgi:hypothetical protein
MSIYSPIDKDHPDILGIPINNIQNISLDHQYICITTNNSHNISTTTKALSTPLQFTIHNPILQLHLLDTPLYNIKTIMDTVDTINKVDIHISKQNTFLTLHTVYGAIRISAIKAIVNNIIELYINTDNQKCFSKYFQRFYYHFVETIFLNKGITVKSNDLTHNVRTPSQNLIQSR